MSKVSWIYAGQRWSSTKKMVYAFYPDTVIAVEGLRDGNPYFCIRLIRRYKKHLFL